MIRWYIEQPRLKRSLRPSTSLPQRLLGRHVVDRADRDAVGRGERRRVVGLHQDAQAEVEHLDLPVLGQEQVGRLDVAVDDSLRVRVGQPEGGLGGVVRDLEGRRSAPGGAAGRGSGPGRTP